MTKRKNYTKEFKQEAARLVIEGGYTQAKAAKNLGVTSNNISKWVMEAKGANIQQPTKTPESIELSQLRKEIQQLRLEREILKKAAALWTDDERYLTRMQAKMMLLITLKCFTTRIDCTQHLDM